MFKILNAILIFFMLSTNAYSAAGAQSDGGNEGMSQNMKKATN